MDMAWNVLVDAMPREHQGKAIARLVACGWVCYARGAVNAPALGVTALCAVRRATTPTV